MSDSHAPSVVFAGGADSLQLEDGGKVYQPGDPIPRLSQARRIALQQAGIRFEIVHHEPTVTPDGKPAKIAAAAQVPEGSVIAAVEAAAPTDTRAQRRSMKE